MFNNPTDEVSIAPKSTPTILNSNPVSIGIHIEAVLSGIADQGDAVTFRHFDGKRTGRGARDEDGRLHARRLLQHLGTDAPSGGEDARGRPGIPHQA